MNNTTSMLIGEQKKLGPIFLGGSGGKPPSTVPMTWSNSNPAVATLSAATGYPVTLTAVAIGTTTITAAAGANGDLTAVLTVNVEDPLSVYNDMNLSVDNV